MKIMIVIIIYFAASSFLAASIDWTWSHAYGKEYWGADEPIIISTSDGGYIVSGMQYDWNTDYNIIVLKITSSGTIAWQKRYVGSSSDNVSSIRQTSDGGYIMAGYTNSTYSGNYQALVLKLDSSGNINWQKTYGGISAASAEGILELQDGSYIVAGATTSFGMGNTDLWILRLGYTGNIIWQRTYGGQGHDGARSIQQTSDGNIIVGASYSTSADGNRVPWILKLDLDGNIIWQRLYYFIGSGGIRSVRQTSDGGYITTGQKWRDESWSDVWVLKLNAAGDIVFQKAYGDIYSDAGYSIMQTMDGGYIIDARSESYKGSYDEDIWLVKIDPSGNIIWQKSYYTFWRDISFSMDIAKDGSYIIAGTSSGIVNSIYDYVWVFKVREDGTMDSTCDFIYDTHVIPYDTDAIAMDMTVVPLDSSAIVTDFNLVAVDLDVQDILVCQTSGIPVLVSHKPMLDDSSGNYPNGIIEPDEPVNFTGAIENTGDVDAIKAEGHLKSNSPIIISNGNASYPDISPGTIENSLTQYSIIAPSVNRPSTHWDITIQESPSCLGCMDFSYDFTYHVGNSFTDVSVTSIFYPSIETILHTRIVNGCAETSFCPLAPVLREQMAKMVCRAMNQISAECILYPCAGIFADVSQANLFCSYIEALYHAGGDGYIIDGCQSSPLSYCPSNIALRQEVAKTVCQAYNATHNSTCGGGSCWGFFLDVPTSNPFCSYIESLYLMEIIKGCSSFPLLFCPSDSVTREQMAKFLVNAFGFTM